MKGIQRNGFLPIIAQAIAEMEEIHGEFSSLDEIRECFKTIKVTKPKYRQVKQRHENRQPSFHTG